MFKMRATNNSNASIISNTSTTSSNNNNNNNNETHNKSDTPTQQQKAKAPKAKYKKFSIGPKIGVLGHKIFPFNNFDSNPFLIEPSKEVKSARDAEEKPKEQSKNTTELINKLLLTNLNEIHKSYFKYLNDNNNSNTIIINNNISKTPINPKKYVSGNEYDFDLERNFNSFIIPKSDAPTLSRPPSIFAHNNDIKLKFNSNNSNSASNKDIINLTNNSTNVGNGNGNANNINSNNTINHNNSNNSSTINESSNETTKIIYQLSKIHLNNKKKQGFKSNGGDYELKTLALVDFKEESL